MCSQVIAPIKNEAGEVCMYILNFEDTDALPEVPNSAEPSSTVRFSKCNGHDRDHPNRTSCFFLLAFFFLPFFLSLDASLTYFLSNVLHLLTSSLGNGDITEGLRPLAQPNTQNGEKKHEDKDNAMTYLTFPRSGTKRIAREKQKRRRKKKTHAEDVGMMRCIH